MVERFFDPVAVEQRHTTEDRFEIPSEAERINYPFYSVPAGREEVRMSSIWQRNFNKFCPDYRSDRLSAFNSRTMPMLLHWGLKGEKRTEVWELYKDQTKCFALDAWQDIKPFSGLNIVDFGSGMDGEFVRLINTLGANAIGIDINSNAEFVTRLADLTVGKRQLRPVADFVLATNMFELQAYRDTLCSDQWGKLADDVLKPGGMILVSNALPEIIANREIFPGVKKDPALHQTFDFLNVPCRIERKDIAKK